MILDCTIIIATKAKEGLYARTEKCSSFSILCLHIFISSFWEKSVEAQFDYFDRQNQESMQRKMFAATSQKMSDDFFEKCLTKKARVRGTPKMLRMVPFREKPEWPFREKPGRQVQNVLQDGGYPGSTIRSWVLLCGERTQQRMHRLRAEEIRPSSHHFQPQPPPFAMDQ